MRGTTDALPSDILYRCADIVVLNKTDMLPKADMVENLKAIVTALNPLAEVKLLSGIV